MIHQGALALIHNTPLIAIKTLVPGKTIHAKIEYNQPGGSIKDRAAYQIIKDAYANGTLVKGQLVVEMTSGNMGAGLAVVCKQYGNPFLAVMSKGNSSERHKILKALGAEILLTDQVDGSPGMVTGKDIAFASEVAKEYAQQHNAFYVDQFNNPSSVMAHYNHTGPEIWRDLPDIQAFVSVVGSAGTFIGTSKFLKHQNPLIQCVAVEPQNAAIIKTGNIINPKHIIQGTGYRLVPPHWDHELVDKIITVSDQQVKDMTQKLSQQHGLFVGYSAGANVVASQLLLEQHPHITHIATTLCDTGYKYTDL